MNSSFFFDSTSTTPPLAVDRAEKYRRGAQAGQGELLGGRLDTGCNRQGAPRGRLSCK